MVIDNTRSKIARTAILKDIVQGLMRRAYDDYGSLSYTFVESVAQMYPYYAIRAAGGFILFLGACVMLFNVLATIRQAHKASATVRLGERSTH